MVLLVGAEGVVDVPLQVDGQVRDPKKRPGHVNQPVEQPAVALRDENTHFEHRVKSHKSLKPLCNWTLPEQAENYNCLSTYTAKH